MQRTLIALALALGLGSAHAALPTDPAASAAPPASAAIAQADAATKAALEWLGHVDAGRGQESYASAAAAFRAAVTEAQWMQAVQATRGPLGKLRARQPLSAKTLHTTPPDMPEGDYVVLQFKAIYANKPEVTEQVTLMQDGGAWRVVGYFLK